MKKLILALFTVLAVGTVSAQQLNIGTYNIRYLNAEDSAAGDGWAKRYPVIANIIKFNDLDVVGIQEGMYKQLTMLNDSLPGYQWIGVGRDGGKKGEHSAILYKSDKFKILKQETFWLSPTDTKNPNVGWDAALTRVCTWALFKEVKTGYTFYFFNLHLDHVGVAARRESAKMVLQKIKEMAGNTPTILTGDFNVNQHNESYTLLNTSGILRDSYELAPIKLATDGTFNGFKTASHNGDARIDHIFVTKQLKPLRYAILTNSYKGRQPSDHYPVVVILGHGK